jgi:hypothetical protein
MATLDQLGAALAKADAAGNADDARVLAAEIRKLRAAPEVAPDPSAGGGTLQFGPLDTGIKTPEWLDRTLAGAGKAGYDLARGAGQLVGAVSRDDVAESRKVDAPLMDTAAGKIGNVLGNVAALAPAALIPAAATIPGGAAIGAATGLIQPSTSTQETLLNTGVGTVAGAAVPAAQRLWAMGKATAEPLTEAGQNAIVGRTLNKAAGKDAPVVAKRLAEAAQPFTGPSQGAPRTMMGEFVPGSIPTVGQAAENAGVSALERAAAANNPAVTNAIKDAATAQNAARVSSLTDLAGTGGQREFFDANRKAAAQQLYDKAYKAGLPKLTPAEEGIVADLMNRPAIKAAMGEAKMLAANEGANIADGAGSVQGLDYVKRALDDQIAKATAGSNEQRILTGLQTKLVGFLDSVSPDYAAARTTFKEMSKPINQMDVAQAIADKSINKLTGTLQPASYAKAFSDQTARQATGFGKATLENTLEPTQMNALNSILLDVRRSNAALNAGRGPGSDTVQKLAYTNLMDQSGLPNFLQNMRPLQVAGNLVARGGDAVYGRANREISNRLAEVMLDPGMAAELMRRATPAQRNQLLQLAAQGASGLAIAAPASANALQH